MMLKVNCGIRRGLFALKARYIATCIGHSSNENFTNSICLKNKYKLFQYRLNETIFNVQFHQSKSFYSTHEKANVEEIENETKKQIVYFGKHASFLKGLKAFSLSTSLLTLLAQPYMYSTMSSMATPAIIVSYSMIGFYVFATPLFIHSLARKYVTEILYDSVNDSYVLHSPTFFLRKKTVHFTMEDVQRNNSMFVSFSIKGKPKIIFEEGFLDKSHYIRMMGYDKPLNVEDILGKGYKEKNEEEKEEKSQTKIG